MGFSNVVGRFSTILAPVVAEKPDPMPMMSCIILSVMALVCCVMLERPKSLMSEKERQNEKVREIF